jgi:hypothetical protein
MFTRRSAIIGMLAGMFGGLVPAQAKQVNHKKVTAFCTEKHPVFVQGRGWVMADTTRKKEFRIKQGA